MKIQHLQWLSLAVGAMDASTGVLLVLFPNVVLGLLGIGAVAGETLVFLEWIGVFVLSVGLSYGLVFMGREAARATWAFTALARALVCVFVSCKVANCELLMPWLLVAISDGAVACVQAFALRSKWWEAAE